MLAAGLVVSALAQDSSKLVGRWYSEQRSRGGIGAVLELRADGTVSYSPAAIVEYAYSFDGQKLVLRYTDPVKGPQPDDVVEVVNLSASNLKLRIGGPAQPVTDWSRVGNSENAGRPLLGHWTAPRDVGGKKVTQNWRFWDTGKALFTIPLSTETGTYRVQKGTMTMKVAGNPSLDGPYSLDGDILTVPGVKSPAKYRRY